MIPVDAQTMFEVAPHFSGEFAAKQAAIVNAVGPVLRPILEENDINSRLRIAHFLGQTCVEAAGFRTTEEFASGDEYEGRTDLGNTQPGDGRRYKGRGLLQLTGRANYRAVGKVLGVPLEENPTLAAEPVLSLRIACQYWKSHQINPACDADDLQKVTRLVNGGLNGLDDRRLFTAKAKAVIARLEGIQLSGAQSVGAAPPGAAMPVLHRGSQGDAVVDLQQRLRKAGFAALAVDGDFGPATEVAVTRFQSDHNLDVDGIVGDKTWAALKTS